MTPALESLPSNRSSETPIISPPFQLKLEAGRNVAKSDTVREILVNETLVHRLGIKDRNK